MSDLIERLRFCANLHPQVGYPENGKLFAEAATALAEAQATIARQQVMLDRALEASFNDRARAERAEAALRKIEAWELPPSGFFYPNADGTDSDRPAPYDSFYGFGSQGGKSAIRAIARAALERSEG